jgi:hypothetical protein
VLIRFSIDHWLVVREVGLNLPRDTGTVAGRADVENVGLSAVARFKLAMLALATTPRTVLEDEWVVTVFVIEGCR